MNHATVAGHLGSDPETRFTPNGLKVTSFRVGCKSRKDDTIWWKVTIWGEQFDKMLPYFKKGSAIIVQGEITKPEVYTDKEGKPQISIQIVASHLSFNPFGKKDGDNKGDSQREQRDQRGHGQEKQQELELSDEEIPF